MITRSDHDADISGLLSKLGVRTSAELNALSTWIASSKPTQGTPLVLRPCAYFYESVSELVGAASGAPRLNHSEMLVPIREAAEATPCTACAAISGRSRVTAR